VTRSQPMTLMIAFALAAGCGASGSSYSHDTTVSYAAEESAPSGGADADYAVPAQSVAAGESVSVADAAPIARSAESEAAPPPPPASPSAAGLGMAGGTTGADGAGAAARRAAPAEAATVTTTTTTSVTVTVDTPTLDVAPEPEPVVQQQAPVQRLLTAASVGDHDRRGNYLDFVRRHSYEGRRLQLDMGRRVRFRVTDRQGQPLNDAQIRLRTSSGTVEGRTHADGRWDFFPGVSAPGAQGAATADIFVEGRSVGSARVQIPGQGDGQDVELRVGVAQNPGLPRVLDLGFLIDVTGSMEDELRYVNREIGDIVSRIRAEAPETVIRVGAIFYRDRSDRQPLQRIAFTSDVAGFARAMNGVRATGGGDYPEDLNAGLQTAFEGLGWTRGNAARVLVTIADAPPKRYQTQFDYREAMRQAAARGVRILPVAASGADREVEFLFRAMGAFTSTPYVYLTDDSGIGNPHMEADTDRVAVEYFNDLLTRVVVSDLRGRGMHEPAGFDR